MPERGIKRQSSDSTCDSSNCVFCVHRFPHPPDQQHDLTAEQSISSPSFKRQLRDFDSWLAAQQNAFGVSVSQEQVAKIGLPTDQLEGYTPFRHSSSNNRQLVQQPQQQSAQSLSDCQQPSSCGEMSGHETPWTWCNSWNELPVPTPAVFREVSHFQQPFNSSNMRSHTADILCGVKFSPDGQFLASAGVAKQVQTYCCVSHACAAPQQLFPLKAISFGIMAFPESMLWQAGQFAAFPTQKQSRSHCGFSRKHVATGWLICKTLLY